jgi:hypothetical protein
VEKGFLKLIIFEEWARARQRGRLATTGFNVVNDKVIWEGSAVGFSIGF